MSRAMNKIPCLIITLCKSPNYGAYLQAFALKEVLCSYGYEVSFLDIYDLENNKKRYRMIFGGLRRNPFSILFSIKKLIAFRKTEKKLKIISRKDISGFKVAFIGSDEIWSVINGSFNSVPEFFGLDLPGFLKFSYAPSVGSTVANDLLNYPKYIEGIKNLDLVSARDIESLEIATKLAGRGDTKLVLDPTFLHDFSNQEVDFYVDRPFILIYTYGFSSEIVQEVKAFANKNNLILLSAGFNHSWADRNVPCTPFEFLSIMKNAKYVITDTFHGSIFAIKYRKNFISFGFNKQKVKYLLESLGLNDCLVSTGYLSQGNAIETNYEKFDETIIPAINTSKKYIESCNSFIKNHL